MDEVRAGVAEAGLQSAVVLVNPGSLHATLFDLINRKHATVLLSAGHEYEAVRSAVERAALTLLAEPRWRLRETVEVTGLDMFL